jgi:hypothetical protein
MRSATLAIDGMNFRPRRTRSVAAWLAVFALVLQSLVPWLHHPGRVAAGDGLLRDLMVLCVAGDVADSTPGDSKDAPATPAKVPHCPGCFVRELAGSPPPIPPALTPQAPAVRVASVEATDRAPASPSYPPQLPRAPPAYA